MAFNSGRWWKTYLSRAAGCVPLGIALKNWRLCDVCTLKGYYKQYPAKIIRQHYAGFYGRPTRSKLNISPIPFVWLRVSLNSRNDRVHSWDLQQTPLWNAYARYPPQEWVHISAGACFSEHFSNPEKTIKFGAPYFKPKLSAKAQSAPMKEPNRRCMREQAPIYRMPCRSKQRKMPRKTLRQVTLRNTPEIRP